METNIAKKVVVKARKSECPKRCTTERQKQAREFQEQIKRSSIRDGIFLSAIIVGLLIFSIFASIKHMQTVDFTLGLVALVTMSFICCFALYWIIKITKHGFSDF